MKRKYYLLAIIFLLIAGCSKELIPEINLSLSSGVITSDYMAGSKTLTFTTNTTWSVSVIDIKGSSWVTVSPMNGEKGNITLTFKALNNSENLERESSVTINAGTAIKSFRIIQDAAPATISIDKKEQNVEVPSGNFSIAVTTNSAPWSTSGVPTWVTLSPSSNSSSGSVSIAYQENKLALSREANIVFTAGSASQTLKVTQTKAAPTISVDKSEVMHDALSGSVNLSVETNSAPWSTSGVPSWITLTLASGNSSASVKVDIQENKQNTAREASIVFTAGTATHTVKISQARADGYIDGGNF